MRDTSCISDQDLKDFFASIDVGLGLNAEMAVKQISDKAIIQLHDRREREYGRKLHDRRMTRNRDRVTRQLLEEIAVYREEILRRYRKRVYVPSGTPLIQRKLDHTNVVQFPIRAEQEPAE